MAKTYVAFVFLLALTPVLIYPEIINAIDKLMTVTTVFPRTDHYKKRRHWKLYYTLKNQTTFSDDQIFNTTKNEISIRSF